MLDKVKVNALGNFVTIPCGCWFYYSANERDLEDKLDQKMDTLTQWLLGQIFQQSREDEMCGRQTPQGNGSPSYIVPLERN